MNVAAITFQNTEYFLFFKRDENLHLQHLHPIAVLTSKLLKVKTRDFSFYH